jgi:hypothetical protein
MTNYRITEVEQNNGGKWYELEILEGDMWKLAVQYRRYSGGYTMKFNSLSSAKKYADKDISQRIKSRKIVYP